MVDIRLLNALPRYVIPYLSNPIVSRLTDREIKFSVSGDEGEGKKISCPEIREKREGKTDVYVVETSSRVMEHG